MKFSIIVPAYNLENYISKCIITTQSQDILPEEYEVLIINDGSTDKTSLIVEGFVKKSTNIILHNKSNGGVSSARNFGIEKAKGEFILFLDGDDSLCSNVLNKLYEKLTSNNLDIARFGYNYVVEGEKTGKTRVLQDKEEVTNGLEFVSKHKMTDFFPWSFVFSSKFLSKHKLVFNSELSYSEDKEFMMRAFCLSHRFQNFEYIHYNYSILREGSATAVYSNKHLKDFISANILIYGLSQNANLKTKYQEFIKYISVKAIEESYYSLSSISLYKRFLVWKTYLKNNKTFNEYIYKNSQKLYVLKKSPLLFYLVYFLPRAVFHKLRKSLIKIKQ